jgi:hypothetical protein
MAVPKNNIDNVRPVLKKSFTASSEYSALLIFRSVEIIIVDNGKTHNPIYI